MTTKQIITPSVIKNNNTNLIYNYIYHHPHVSQQDLTLALQLSRPTVTNNLSLLESEGMIRRGGTLPSDSVGRKAVAYEIVENYRIALGVEIQETHFKVLIVDLRGKYSNREVFDVLFDNTLNYVEQVCNLLNDYIVRHELNRGQLLGIGMTIQGLVNPEGTQVTYGKILNCTGMEITPFAERLPAPCRFLHDSTSAGLAETWFSPEMDDFVYLMIGYHLGSCVISRGRYAKALHGHTGTIEHMRYRKNPLHPRCYCGLEGCYETWISLSGFLKEGERTSFFFQHMRDGEPEYVARWEEYLRTLGFMIAQLHLVNDTDYVIGGYMARYLRDEDFTTIYQAIRENTAFEEEDDFLHISKQPKHNITIGAGIYFIQEFLHQNS